MNAHYKTNDFAGLSLHNATWIQKRSSQKFANAHSTGASRQNVQAENTPGMMKAIQEAIAISFGES